MCRVHTYVSRAHVCVAVSRMRYMTAHVEEVLSRWDQDVPGAKASRATLSGGERSGYCWRRQGVSTTAGLGGGSMRRCWYLSPEQVLRAALEVGYPLTVPW